jgi:hypothetical protein
VGTVYDWIVPMRPVPVGPKVLTGATQVPEVQTVPPEQTVPHAPQCDALVLRFVSQPSVATPLQLPKPLLQVNPQVRAAQFGTALARGGHAVAQAPQLFGSVATLVQLPEQLVRPAAQVTTQALSEQTVPAAQTVPHTPQLELSTRRSRQTPEQLVCPAGHTSEHALATQLWPDGQTVPHAP